jgi:uncharacterized membrane protein
MKKIFSFISILTSIVSAGNIIVTGNIQPASIVGFDESQVNSSTYTTNEDKFLHSEIEVDIRLGEAFTLKKNLYVKSNSTGGLKMAMSASDGYGDLKNGRYNIVVDYYLHGDKVTMDGTDYKTLYSSNSTPNQVVTLSNAWKIVQQNTTSSTQDAGDYTATITVSLSAI